MLSVTGISSLDPLSKNCVVFPFLDIYYSLTLLLDSAILTQYILFVMTTNMTFGDHIAAWLMTIDTAAVYKQWWFGSM